MAQEESNGGKEALAELRECLARENPAFLAQCERLADQVMDQYKDLGDSGLVAMTFLSIRIAAEMDR
jgi:hypothetical protein